MDDLLVVKGDGIIDVEGEEYIDTDGDGIPDYLDDDDDDDGIPDELDEDDDGDMAFCGPFPCLDFVRIQGSSSNRFRYTTRASTQTRKHNVSRD